MNTTRFQFRQWWTTHDDGGRCDAQLVCSDTKFEAVRIWETACRFRWVPVGCSRSCVSQVQIWRSDSKGPWFRYGEVPATADTYGDDWPFREAPEGIDLSGVLARVTEDA